MIKSITISKYRKTNKTKVLKVLPIFRGWWLDKSNKGDLEVMHSDAGVAEIPPITLAELKLLIMPPITRNNGIVSIVLGYYMAYQ